MLSSQRPGRHASGFRSRRHFCFRRPLESSAWLRFQHGYVVAGHARQDQGQNPAEKRPAEREIQYNSLYQQKKHARAIMFFESFLPSSAAGDWGGRRTMYAAHYLGARASEAGD